MDSENYEDYGGVEHVEYCFQVNILSPWFQYVDVFCLILWFIFLKKGLLMIGYVSLSVFQTAYA